MDTWLVIVLVVGAIVLLAFVFWGATRARARKFDERREEAGAHRERAELRSRQAEERELDAREELERAERERAVAEKHAVRADEIDPDVEVDRTPRDTA